MLIIGGKDFPSLASTLRSTSHASFALKSLVSMPVLPLLLSAASIHPVMSFRDSEDGRIHMRITRTLFAAVAVLLLSVASGVAQIWSVQSADYGIGKKQQDVTATVRQLVKGPNFQVSNKDLGIDPAPGQDKTLRIVARDPKGTVRTFTYNERQTVDTKMFGGKGAATGVVADNSGLRILHAEYCPAGTKGCKDVTQHLQSMAKDNHLQLVVNSKSMGVDPAPGKPKNLLVRYQYGDRVYMENVKENGELILPSPNKARGVPVD
jgi:hypothetical protein